MVAAVAWRALFCRGGGTEESATEEPEEGSLGGGGEGVLGLAMEAKVSGRRW